MRRSAFLVLLMAITTAAPLLAAGTPLQSGRVYLLKGATGRFLSAQDSPAQGLTLSPNTSGWEQWLYTSDATGKKLTSFHGSSLILDAGGFVFHAPFVHYDDQPLIIQGVTDRSSNKGTVGIDGSAVEGGRITIARQNPQVALLMRDSGQASPAVGMQSTADIGNGLIVPVSFPSEQWTIIPVASPDMSRKAPVEGLNSHEGFGVRSAHNSYLKPGTLTPPPPNQGGHGVFRVLHGPLTQSSSVLIKNESRLSAVKAVRFGDVLRVGVVSSSQAQYQLRSSNGTAGPNNLQRVSAEVTVSQADVAAASWTLVDPAGRYRNGDRVPTGYPVILRNSAAQKNLSADSGFAEVLLSPNGGGWEKWVFTQ